MTFSVSGTRRSNGGCVMNVESVGVTGRTDSVAQPVSGQNIQRSTRPRRCCVYPELRQPMRRTRSGAGSVILKNETG